MTIHAILPSGETAVPQGVVAAFEIRRSGNLSQATAVRVQTVEPLRQGGFGSNPTEKRHIVNFEPNETTATLHVPANGDSNGTNHGWIRAVTQGHSTYIQGNPREADITIRAATGDDAVVSIAPSEDSIAEGENAGFTLTRTGDTSSSLTAKVRVEDPGQAMRGNHWDPAPRAGDVSKDVTLQRGPIPGGGTRLGTPSDHHATLRPGEHPGDGAGLSPAALRRLVLGGALGVRLDGAARYIFPTPRRVVDEAGRKSLDLLNPGLDRAWWSARWLAVPMPTAEQRL